MSLLDLPAEIIHRIGTELSLPQYKQPSEASMLSGLGALEPYDEVRKREFASPTCRRLRGILRPQLFCDALKLFLFEDPVDDPKLGINTVSRVEKLFKIYHYLLSKLPNLEHLSVAEGPSSGAVFYGLLEASQGRSPSIDATDNIGGPPQQPEPLDPFVGRLKTLQIEYTIYGSGDDFWRPMIPVLDQLTSLKHLVLNVGWTSNWCPCHMLGRIPSSLDTLVLRGTIPCPAAIIVRAIADRHSNIQTLITSGSPDVFDTTPTHPWFTPDINRLERLQILKVDIDQFDKYDIEGIFQLAATLRVVGKLSLLVVQVGPHGGQCGLWRWRSTVTVLPEGMRASGNAGPLREETEEGVDIADGDWNNQEAQQIIDFLKQEPEGCVEFMGNAILPIQPGDLTALLAGPPDPRDYPNPEQMPLWRPPQNGPQPYLPFQDDFAAWLSILLGG